MVLNVRFGSVLLLWLIASSLFWAPTALASRFEQICASSNLPPHGGSLPVNPGMLQNKDRSGTGWTLAYSPLQDGGSASQLNTHLIWYTFRADGSPVWYMSDPIRISPPSATAPSFTTRLYEYRWDYNAPRGERLSKFGTPYAEVSGFFAANDQTRLAVEWSLWQNAQKVGECLNDVSREFLSQTLGGREGVQALSTQSVNLAFNGAYYDRSNSGWGMQQHVVRTDGQEGQSLFRETLALAIYDDGGRATWLLGLADGADALTPRPPSVGSWRQLPLTLYRAQSGFNPANPCGPSGCAPFSAPAGRWFRQFVDTVTVQGALDVDYRGGIGGAALTRFDVGVPPIAPQTIPRSWATLTRLSLNNYIVVDRVPCRVLPGQGTCNIAIHWSADPVTGQRAQVRRVHRRSGTTVSTTTVGLGAYGEVDATLDPTEFGLATSSRLVFELVIGGRVVSQTPELYAVPSESDPLADVADAPYPTAEAIVPHSPGLTRMPATAGVSGGAASYSVPLTVAPGRRGMEPAVSLEYSSRSGNGIAGMGFSLSAGGSIHRCPMTLEQDGLSRGVQLDAQDRLCLDGQRLQRVSGSSYGQTGAVYATEIDSHVRVRQVAGDLANAQTVFEVRTKSGEVHIYGALGQAGALVRPQALGGSNSLLPPLSWMLAERRDSVGNTVRYFYNLDAADAAGTRVPEVLLREISYTGRRLGDTVTEGNRSIKFTYEARPDASSSLIGGGVLWQTQRLSRIDIHAPAQATLAAPSERIRAYQLAYVLRASGGPALQPDAVRAQANGVSLSSGRSLLRSIQELAFKDGVQASRDPTEFLWQDGVLQVQTRLLSEVVSGLPANLQPIRSVGDFDGDGHRELLARGADGRYILVSLDADRRVQWTVDISGALSGIDGGVGALLEFTDAFVDVDLDGRVDLRAFQSIAASNGTQEFQAQNASPTAAGASEVVYYRLGTQVLGTNANFNVAFPVDRRIRTGESLLAQLRDLDGDGYPDVHVVERDSPHCSGQGTRIRFRKNRFATQPADPFGVTTPATQPSSFCLAGAAIHEERQPLAAIQDINGDGIPDFALGYKAGESTVTHSRNLWGHVRLGSVSNGLYVVGPEQTFAAFLGEGDLRRIWGDRPEASALLTGDFNGDGQLDLAWPSWQNGTPGLGWAFRFGTGKGFGPAQFTQRAEGLVYAHVAESSPTHFLNAGRLRVADTNADGRDEVLFPSGFAQHLCARNQNEGIPERVQEDLNGTANTARNTCVDARSRAALSLFLHPAGSQATCFANPLPATLALGGHIRPGEYYYACPEDPITGQPTVVPSAGDLTARFVDAPDGHEMKFVGAYAAGMGDSDMSIYTYSALDIALTPRGVTLGAARDTGLKSSQYSTAFADDLFSDGLLDATFASGAGCVFGKQVPGCGISRVARSNINTTRGIPDRVKTFESVGDARTPPQPMNPAPRISESRGVGAPSFGNTPTLPDLLSSVVESVAGNVSASNVFEWRYSPLSGRAGRGSGSLALYSLEPPAGESRYTDDRHFYFTSSMPVVAQFSRPAGVLDASGQALQNTTLFGYGQAMYHVRGRGFQGFRSIHEWDLSQGSALETIFHQRFPLTGRIERQTLRALLIKGEVMQLRQPLSVTSNAWRCGLGDRSTCPANGQGWAGGFPFLDRSVVETFDAQSASLDQVTEAYTRRTVSYAPWTGLADDSCPALPADTGGASGYDSYGNLLKKFELVEDLGSQARLAKACSLEEHVFEAPQDAADIWWVNRLQSTTQHRRVQYADGHAPPASVSAEELNPRQSRRTTFEWDPYTRLLFKQHEQLLKGSGVEALTSAMFQYPATLPVACAGMSGFSGTNYGLPSCVRLTRGGSLAGSAASDGINLGSASPLTRDTRTAFTEDGYFATEVRNALGHTASTVTRPRDGQPSSATDITGLKTEMDYDAFGALVRTRYPARTGSLTRQPDVAVGLQACSASVSCAGLRGARYRQQTSAVGAPTRMQYFDALGREIAAEVEVRAQVGAIGGTRYSRTGVIFNRRGLVEKQATPTSVSSFGQLLSGWPTAYTEFGNFDVLGRPRSKRERGFGRVGIQDPYSTVFEHEQTAPDRITTYTYSRQLTTISAGLMQGSSTTDARELSRELDGLGRHLRTQDASDPGNVGGSGGVTDYWFDAWGHPLAIRDARGAVTRAVHDAAGRRYATHDPNQGSSLYLYSGFGELLRQVDARGLRQDFRYDGLGRQIERRTGGLAGCASSATARRATDYGNTCGATLIDTYFFDGVQQRGGGVDVHALGLPSGHERRITPAGGAERLERRVWDVFDSHGRVIERRTQQSLATAGPVVHSGERSYVHRWKYDSRYGRVLAEAWPNGIGRSFTYSSIGAVESENGLGAEMPLVLRQPKRVNALGQVTEEVLGDRAVGAHLVLLRGQVEATGEQTLVAYGRQSGPQAATAAIWQENYRYDGFGNLVRRAQRHDDGIHVQTEGYRYDRLHRMTESRVVSTDTGVATVHLGYDVVGNLLKKSDFSANQADAYGYASAGEARPNAVSQVRLANGSLRRYGYDASGNLVCQTDDGQSGSCDQWPQFEAYYNHNQQPSYQRRKASGSGANAQYAESWYSYGADQQPARQWGIERIEGCTLDSLGCLRHHRIYLDRYEDSVGTLRHIDGRARQARTRAYIGDYLVATRGDAGQLELSYLLRDRLGSVVGVEQVTLSDRRISGLTPETRHAFDAFGAPRSNRWWSANRWHDIGTWYSPTRTQQGFTGHERLSGLQLIHMRGRVFDPVLGRFHGVDPIIQFPLSSQGLNPYSYILNNPMAGVDPTGYACDAELGTRTRKCASVTAEYNGVTTDLGTINVNSAADRAALRGTLAKYLDDRGLLNSNGASVNFRVQAEGQASSSDIGSVGESRGDRLTRQVLGRDGAILLGMVGGSAAAGGALAGGVAALPAALPNLRALLFSFHLAASRHAPTVGDLMMGDALGSASFGSLGAGGIAGGMYFWRSVATESQPLLPRVFIKQALTSADFPSVATEVSQKQFRHIAGRHEHAARGGGSYLNSMADAQAVLDAYHSGSATIIGKSARGFPVVRVEAVTGVNVNVGAGFPNQPTNVFIIKGTASPSVVPTNPNWIP